MAGMDENAVGGGEEWQMMIIRRIEMPARRSLDWALCRQCMKRGARWFSP